MTNMMSILYRSLRTLLVLSTVLTLLATPIFASPILIANNLGSSESMVSTGGRVFFMQSNGVSSVPLSATSLVTPTNVVNAISQGSGQLMTDGTTLFGATQTYTSQGYFWSASVDGVNQNRTQILRVSQLGSHPGSGGSLHGVTDTGIIVDSRFESGPLYTSTKDGTSQTGLTNFNSWARSSTFDGTYVFWQRYLPSTDVFRTDVATGNTITFRNSTGYEYPVFSDENYVYFVDGPSGSPATIRYSDKTNGNVTTDLVSDVTRIGWGTSVDGYVYFYNDPTASIARIAVGGGDIESIVAIDAASVRDILVVDDTLYYIDGSGGAGQHELYLVAVPEPSSLGLMAGLALLLTRRPRNARRNTH